MPRAPAAHREAHLQPVPHRVVAVWPVGTFIENIAVLRDGAFALSIHNQRQILRVERDGSSAVWAQMPVSPAGLMACGDGVLAVGGEVGVEPHRVYHVAANGRVDERLVIPGTLFLNGFTPISSSRAVTVDSLRGQIIEVDTTRWTSRVLITDERLAKCSDEPLLPGVNGVKMLDDALYLTNTDRALVLRAAMSSDGDIAELSVVAEGLRGDDLAADTDGRLYVTNHIHNTLTRIERDGSRPVAIAGPQQGMPGCTACAFHPDDAGALYVTTTGGLIMPFEGTPQEAKLVRLDVGARGFPLPQLD